MLQCMDWSCFTYGYLIVLSNWKRLLYSMNYLLTFIKKSIVWVYFWTLYFAVIHISILIPMWDFLDYFTSVINLKISCVSSPTPFFFKVAVTILGSLYFHMNFRISLSISTKSLLIFSSDCIEPVNHFGEYGGVKYWTFWPINMVVFSTYLSLHLFLSIGFYSFQYIGLGVCFIKFIF